MIRFFNTLSGKVEPFVPLRKGEVKLYTCGPTVYDHSHIGNYRAYVFEDLLKRFLRSQGFRVTHVMNITDVDDKTIRGAAEKKVTLKDYTDTYIQSFFEGLRILNISPADHYPRATDHIPEMVEMIRGLLDKGFAYEKDGSVYFSIAKFPSYGRLSKIDLNALSPGQRSDADEYEKENVHDFALWKKNKEGEPFWETELGPGRPGWHIECSAMSSKYLGPTFDIHCGGVDNIFPHHENEIAQSIAFSGRAFVKYWLHCHHLIVYGEKMSKSKGNTFTLEDMPRHDLDPLDLRLLLLSTHYRKTLNFTFESAAQAKASRRRLVDFRYELENRPWPEASPGRTAPIVDEAGERFAAGLSDDLNIASAMTALFELVKKANILIQEDALGREDAQGLLDFLESADGVLAVLPPRADQGLPPELLAKIEEREKARRGKNFELADRIRDELLIEGVLLEDTKDGVRWKIVKK